MAFRKIEAGLVQSSVDNFIGKKGTIFYDNDDGALRLSDGQTPGGNLLSGGAGGDYTLPTASTTVKGGVKIDGSTITIANQVISVGTVPYSNLSGTPTIPTNNNELTNGAAYITSAALTGLATETYVTTRGYLTTVAYADVTGKPTLFSGSYTDLTDKPNIPSLTGYATETFVTTRGYLTSVGTISYNDLTNKPTIPAAYTFNVAADDSTLRTIGTEETIKFVGAGGITTSSDAEGAITITQATTSSLVNSTKTVSLGSDGALTLPEGGRINALGYNNIVRLGNDGFMVANGAIFNENEDGLYLGGQNSDAGTYIQIPGRTSSENSEPLIISHQWDNTSIDIQGGSGTWSFGTGGTLSLPNNGKISSGVSISQAGSSFAYAQNAFGQAGGDTGSVFLPSDTNSRAIVAGYTLVSNTGVTLTVTSISIVAGPPSFVSVSTTPTASSFTYPVTVYSADYVAGYTAPEWQFGTNGSLTFPNGTTQITAAESFSFSVAADDSTQRAISNNELIKFIGAGGITTSSDAEGAITITQSAAAAGTLTGTELKSTVVTSSLTSVGTLTSLSSGAITTTGTLAVNAAGGITTNQTTFLLVNTTATTVTAFGAATTINLGYTNSVAFSNTFNIAINAQEFGTKTVNIGTGGTVTGSTYVNIGSTLGPSYVTVNGTLTATLSGNASTATKLATARAINGVNFDGSAAITVTADAGTLSGSTLASGVTASSLTSVGTLAGLRTTGLNNFGSNTFTKAGYATGDITLDNGGTDTPGLLMYYANNNNFAFDSWNGTFNILSGQLLRVVNNLNESGGAVKMAMDTTGNMVTTGFILPGAYRAGQVIRDTMLNNSDFTVNNTTVATSTTDTTLLTYSYTPTSSSSYLIIHIHVADYRAASDTGGAGTDSYFSRIKVDDAEIVYSRQMTRSGDSFRTGSLFPLTGRYTNSDTTAKTITVGVRRDSADDSITVTNSATALTLRITEIAR
jgi:hypothetical protein